METATQLAPKVDAANLAVFYPHNIFPADKSTNLLESTENVFSALNTCLTSLFATLKSCEQTHNENGTILTLPAPTTVLPREKPMPKKSKFETSWERFQKKKGIRKHGNQLNKMYDEDTREWRDKWGKRAREHERRYDWIREVGDRYTPNSEGGDPFLDTKQERKARKQDIQKKAAKNERKRERFDRAVVPQSNKKGAKLSTGIGSRDAAQIKSLSKQQSNIATASMGKFDRIKRKK